MSAIDQREYEKLDDNLIEEDDKRYQAQVKSGIKATINPITLKEGEDKDSKPKTACCAIF